VESTTLPIPALSPEQRRRFTAKVRIAPDGCHEWTAAKTPNGYGQFGRFMAHRVALAEATGVRDTQLTVDHLCFNRRCVNPEHLEWTSMRENNLRSNGVSGRNARKDACDNGHPFDAENTYIRPSGGRDCKTCRREAGRRLRERRAA